MNISLQGWEVFTMKHVTKLNQNGRKNKTVISPKSLVNICVPSMAINLIYNQPIQKLFHTHLNLKYRNYHFIVLHSQFKAISHTSAFEVHRKASLSQSVFRGS